MEDINDNGEFSASGFVTCLLDEGSRSSCDDTNDSFNRKGQLPSFYDEEKFKRGQRFFHRNIFALFFTKVLGLVSILSIPDLVQILKFTKMSSEPLPAYKRYLSTVFHMCVWYESDFEPNSDLWRSLNNVRCKHNAASKKSYSVGENFISQKNMAITQFGFMGYAVAKTKFLGIHDATREDLEAFVHLWRVIGHLMGIEERFNICRDNLDETVAICQEIVDRVFRVEINKKHVDYVHMANTMMEGMWCMMPAFEPTVFLQFIFLTVNQTTNNNNVNDDGSFDLNIFQRIYVRIIIFTLYTLKYTLFRILHNYNFYLCLWLMKKCPFLAYYKFGKENSHISICNRNNGT